MKRLSAIQKLVAFFLLVCGGLSAGAEPPDTSEPWPFSPPVAGQPPSVQRTEWLRNKIDAFILAKLESKGLSPAPEAAKQALIRRVYFDLIGLPPTPEEVRAFLDDSDPRAYENAVDRLLADSRYGERWARMWLDLARYADTAGYEGDPDLPHAWRYRDYVIDALNTDKPYDVFVKEQIAGDEFEEIMGAGDLPETPSERIVAMTFLRLAPFTEPRGDETRHEMLSEMTATTGSVLLGLTVGCAKCHDHKYDSIPTKDFYRLKAFFATVSIPRPEPGDGFQIGGPLPAEFYRSGENEWAQRQRARTNQAIQDSKTELAQLTTRLEKQLALREDGFGVQSKGGPLGNHYFFDRRSVVDDRLHHALINSDGSAWRLFTDGNGPGDLGTLAGENRGDWFGDIPSPAHVSLGMHTAGTGGPKGNPHHGRFAEILIYDHPLSGPERDAVAAYIEKKYRLPDEGVAEPPDGGLRFWLDASDLDADPNTANPPEGAPIAAWKDKIGGVTLAQDSVDRRPVLDTLGQAKAPAVRFDDDLLVGPTAGAPFLADQRGAIVVVFSSTSRNESYGFEVGGDGAFVSTVICTGATAGGSLAEVLRDAENDLVTKEDRDRYQYLTDRQRLLRQQLKRLQPVAMSLRHSYGPPYEPRVPTSRVMIRGEYDNPGEVVEPGFLSCITGNQQPAKIRLDPFKRWPTRSRRMALARWIASPDNPLTARVMANRLWHWHFGRGIVATPSDFGALSGGPSHQELLDWLATRFVKESWSLKAMHRLIVTSSTYRQSSRRRSERAEQVDPENELLWRFRRRRLEAEAIRDSVLAVSGRLNAEQFGLPIFPPLPGDLAQRVKYTNSKWDTQYGPEGRKRSVYIYQQRTLTTPLMQVFDALVCDESRPRRRHSVTPLQALAMYNGEFVNEEAKHFAHRVRDEAGDDLDRQIERAFKLSLSREPTKPEMDRMRAFLQEGQSRQQALAGLCRILFNSNEFVYID